MHDSATAASIEERRLRVKYRKGPQNSGELLHDSLVEHQSWNVSTCVKAESVLKGDWPYVLIWWAVSLTLILITQTGVLAAGYMFYQPARQSIAPLLFVPIACFALAGSLGMSWLITSRRHLKPWGGLVTGIPVATVVTALIWLGLTSL